MPDQNSSPEGTKDQGFDYADLTAKAYPGDERLEAWRMRSGS